MVVSVCFLKRVPEVLVEPSGMWPMMSKATLPFTWT